METLTIINLYTRKKVIVKAKKQEGYQIYDISARQFDRIRSNLGHGPIEIDCEFPARIDVWKRNGDFLGWIDSRN